MSGELSIDKCQTNQSSLQGELLLRKLDEGTRIAGYCEHFTCGARQKNLLCKRHIVEAQNFCYRDQRLEFLLEFIWQTCKGKGYQCFVNGLLGDHHHALTLNDLHVQENDLLPPL